MISCLCCWTSVTSSNFKIHVGSFSIFCCNFEGDYLRLNSGYWLVNSLTGAQARWLKCYVDFDPNLKYKQYCDNVNKFVLRKNSGETSARRDTRSKKEAEETLAVCSHHGVLGFGLQASTNKTAVLTQSWERYPVTRRSESCHSYIFKK